MAGMRRKSAGRDWLAEAGGVRSSSCALPEAASPNIIAAPARGPVVLRPQYETVMTPSGPRTRRATADGFHPVAAEDAFDRMALQARRSQPAGEPMFTVAQVEAGRAYAALAERCASEGMRCSSPEARQGGGGAGDWMDGVLGRSYRLDRMRREIGNEPVLKGDGRVGINTLELVNLVCRDGLTVSQILQRKGWPVYGDRVAVVIEALRLALDRIS